MATKKDGWGFSNDDPYLEANVPKKAQKTFEARYKAATGTAVKPASPPDYFEVNNKWGPELRIYFNSASVAKKLTSAGVNFEPAQPFRKEYKHRLNNNDIWWDLVENYGFRIGQNGDSA